MVLIQNLKQLRLVIIQYLVLYISMLKMLMLELFRAYQNSWQNLLLKMHGEKTDI